MQVFRRIEPVFMMKTWLIPSKTNISLSITMSLLDVHRDYYACRGKSELAQWHAALLRRCGATQIGGEGDGGYWGDRDGGRRLVHHLAGGGSDEGAERAALPPELTELRCVAPQPGPQPSVPGVCCVVADAACGVRVVAGWR